MNLQNRYSLLEERKNSLEARSRERLESLQDRCGFLIRKIRSGISGLKAEMIENGDYEVEGIESSKECGFRKPLQETGIDVSEKLDELGRSIRCEKKELESMINKIGEINLKAGEELNGIKRGFTEEINSNRKFLSRISDRIEGNSRELIEARRRLDTCCMKIEEKPAGMNKKFLIHIGIILCVAGLMFFVNNRFFF